MKKTIIFTFIFLFMLTTVTTQAFAHTHLLSSNPKDGSIISEELNEIVLTFDTAIEQTSSFELQDSNGDTITVEDITVSQDSMSGTVSEPLANDDYTVYWENIGADGHAMQGEFSFTVDVPVTAPEEDQDATKSDTESTDGEESNETDTPDVETDSTDVQEEESSNTLMFVIISVIIMVIAAIIVIRRKN